MNASAALSRWVEFAAEASRQPVKMFPTWPLLDLLHDTFEATAEWNALAEDGSLQRALAHPPPGWPPPGLDEYAAEHLSEHPVVRWFGQTRSVTPMTIERVPATIAEPSLVQAGRELMGSADMRQQLVIPLWVSVRSHAVFTLSRGGRDFAVEEFLLAHQVQPLLMVMERQSKVAASVAYGLTDWGLTLRESAVLGLLHRNLTTTSIAARLGCSPRTVEKHIEHIYRKLGVRDRVAAIRAVDGCRLESPPMAGSFPVRHALPDPPPGDSYLLSPAGHVPHETFAYRSHARSTSTARR